MSKATTKTPVKRTPSATRPTARPAAREPEPAEIEELAEETTAEEVIDEAGIDVDAVFAECDASIQEAYENTSGRFAPPAGDYVFTFVTNPDTGKCGTIRTRKPKDDDDEPVALYPILNLDVEITMATDPELCGTQFSIPFFLKPYADKREGGKMKVAGGDRIKELVKFIFGDDQAATWRLNESCEQLLAGAGGIGIRTKVTYKKGSDFPNYSFKGVADVG